MSIKEIARVVGVAPSSVSLWVRDVELDPGGQRDAGEGEVHHARAFTSAPASMEPPE